MPEEFNFVENEHTLLGWFFVESFTNLLEKEQKAYFGRKARGSKKTHTVQLQFIANGVEFPVKETFALMEAERDRQIKEEAVNLVAEKFKDISDIIYQLKKEVLRKAREDLGLNPDDLEW